MDEHNLPYMHSIYVKNTTASDTVVPTTRVAFFIPLAMESHDSAQLHGDTSSSLTQWHIFLFCGVSVAVRQAGTAGLAPSELAELKVLLVLSLLSSVTC
jgi:hypothetical protein